MKEVFIKQLIYNENDLFLLLNKKTFKDFNSKVEMDQDLGLKLFLFSLNPNCMDIINKNNFFIKELLIETKNMFLNLNHNNQPDSSLSLRVIFFYNIWKVIYLNFHIQETSICFDVSHQISYLYKVAKIKIDLKYKTNKEVMEFIIKNEMSILDKLHKKQKDQVKNILNVIKETLFLDMISLFLDKILNNPLSIINIEEVAKEENVVISIEVFIQLFNKSYLTLKQEDEKEYENLKKQEEEEQRRKKEEYENLKKQEEEEQRRKEEELKAKQELEISQELINEKKHENDIIPYYVRQAKLAIACKG